MNEGSVAGQDRAFNLDALQNFFINAGGTLDQRREMLEMMLASLQSETYGAAEAPSFDKEKKEGIGEAQASNNKEATAIMQTDIAASTRCRAPDEQASHDKPIKPIGEAHKTGENHDDPSAPG